MFFGRQLEMDFVQVIISKLFTWFDAIVEGDEGL
jgi:hypothetical protein